MDGKDVILFSKCDTFSQAAQTLASCIFGERLLCVSGRVGDPLPDEVRQANPKVVLSFLSPWILPKWLLDSAEIALNWHPASRDYPGIGCYNFALYDEAPEYGAICHYMAEKVDTGHIVEERRFKLFPSDTVESLKLRTMVTMTDMFHHTITQIAAGIRPPTCPLSWSRKPYTRRELNALTVITTDMQPEEVRRRIRATTYPGYPGPSVVVGGETFQFPVPNRPPLA